MPQFNWIAATGTGGSVRNRLRAVKVFDLRNISPRPFTTTNERMDNQDNTPALHEKVLDEKSVNGIIVPEWDDECGILYLWDKEKKGTMEYNHCIEVRISIPRANAKVPSVEKIWRIADWFERETYDMLGIEFTGHRDLRRILLPEDWEGWPLRKDYQVQETYHGIVVPKMKEGWE